MAAGFALTWDAESHRMTDRLRLEGTSESHLVQPPQLKQDHLKQAAQDHVQMNISNTGDSATCLGNLCQCLVSLTIKKCFLTFAWNVLCFSLCLLPLVLSLGTTEKSLTPSLYPLQIFIHIDEIPSEPSLF